MRIKLLFLLAFLVIAPGSHAQIMSISNGIPATGSQQAAITGGGTPPPPLITDTMTFNTQTMTFNGKTMTFSHY